MAIAAAMVLILVSVWIGAAHWIPSRSDPAVPARLTTSPLAQPTPSVRPPAPPVIQPVTSASPVSPAWAKRVKLGVYRGTSRQRIAGFESWLGRDVDYAVDFSTRDTWNDIANPAYMIRQWSGSSQRMVYSTGLLPSSGSYTVARGAGGAYDSYFRTLARNLVRARQGDAIIRLGWEFNLESSRWSTNKPADFVAYWRHVVTAMRSIPGQHFQFDWNPNVGDTAFDATAYYPGSAYVDYVGVDVYDVSWAPQTYPYPAGCDAACRLVRQQTVWDQLYDGQHGLGFWAQFAQARKKPMSLPEWGVWQRTDHHGGGDDPYFVEQMYRFIADPANNVAYQAYFETDSGDGAHRLMTTMPNAGKAFRKYFG